MRPGIRINEVSTVLKMRDDGMKAEDIAKELNVEQAVIDSFMNYDPVKAAKLEKAREAEAKAKAEKTEKVAKAAAAAAAKVVNQE